MTLAHSPTLRTLKRKVSDFSSSFIFLAILISLENRPPVPTSFSELDRLAFVVRAIENDCATVPVGSFKLTPAHELRYDDHFQGLSPCEAYDINNWQHFREPQSDSKKEVISMEEAVFFKKFLDDLQDDKPRGCWSL